jgi:5-methylcytosine-specific restriction endonuclease McrA
MQRVLVIDKNKKALMPTHPARARALLKAGKAAVFRRFPFTLILKARAGGETQPVALKIDPGSKTTGFALVADFQSGKRVVWAAELTYRGQQIRDALLSRRQLRRARRQRQTRYQAARFHNRRRGAGWLPPSLQSRVENIGTWTVRLARCVPITSLSQELVRFDMQLMQNAEISGVEYQQGELQGYEVREYLLEKWGRKCAYCGKTNVPLEIEHIFPKVRGGSNRVANLSLACHDCNQRKGTQTAAEFGYPDIQAKAKQPLKDAAAVNATRWAVFERLKRTGLPVEGRTGGRTKFNRVAQGYPKAHWIDAACVGESGANVRLLANLIPLSIKATGRQMTLPDKHGFPHTKAKTSSTAYGFKTGDFVKAIVPTGKSAGVHVGRVAIRKRPSFALNGVDVHPRYLTTLHHSDGYTY